MDDNGILIENAQVELESFAPLFEFDGDQRHIRHILYNCAASRPGIEGKTNEDAREVQTETLTIKATPLSSSLVKAKTENTTDTTVYNDWYKAVYMPVVAEEDAGGVAKHADASIPNTLEEWLDGFNTFSLYQMLTQLIELWGLNVQTVVEAKKLRQILSMICMQKAEMMTVHMPSWLHKRILIDFNFEKHPQNNKNCGCFLK